MIRIQSMRALIEKKPATYTLAPYMYKVIICELAKSNRQPYSEVDLYGLLTLSQHPKIIGVYVSRRGRM